MSTITKGTLFPPALIPGLIQKTIGASAIAKLCAAQPIPFNGMTEMTFSLDNEIDVVAENGKKTPGGASVGTVTVVPIKVEYSARVSDEFLYGSEEYRLSVLEAFSEGYAMKLAKGLDLMAFHGINPRTGSASTVIGNNHFDSKIPTEGIITIAAGDTPDANIEAAIAKVQGADRNVNGLIMAPVFKADLAKLEKKDGAKLYPELAWGNAPGVINGLRTETTSNLSAGSSKDRALVGDFAGSFRWGYAKEIPVEVIKYGNPDNDPEAGDLAGHNQVLIRCETYLGWGILDPKAFAMIRAGA